MVQHLNGGNDKFHAQLLVAGHWNLPSEKCVRANYCTVTFDYTGCPRRNVPNFGRVFLRLKYTDITQNTYIQS